MEKGSKSDVMTLRHRLVSLRRQRERRKASNRRPRRRQLTAAERAAVLSKTGGKCHICGGEIQGAWNADHVLAHSGGGGHSADNYLPSHGTCNNYRWDYLPQEFELILKLGVWVRTQVEKGTTVGRAIERGFSQYEARRISRRKKPRTKDGI